MNSLAPSSYRKEECLIGKTPLAIFCGTGGVGKTSLAATYALFLVQKNPKKKILLITIDPSLRLKDFFKLPENNPTQDFFSLSLPEIGNFDLLLLQPFYSFSKISSKTSLEKNRLVKLLMSNFGGMQEIMGMIELYNYYSSQYYDFIILDTPPGKHFLDFLNSCQKIRKFFHNKVFDLLKSFSSQKKLPIWKKILIQGPEKLLFYLEKMTGEGFLQEFLETVILIRENYQLFTNALEMENILKDPNKTASFYVTSCKHYKADDLEDFALKSQETLSKNSYIVLNRQESSILFEQTRHSLPPLEMYLKYIQEKEKNISLQIQEKFPHFSLLCFNESSWHEEIDLFIKDLLNQWKGHLS